MRNSFMIFININQAEDLVNPAAPSQLAQYQAEVQESVYKSRKSQLGKAYDYEYNLPDKVKSPEFRFGITGTSSMEHYIYNVLIFSGQSAKELLFPEDNIGEADDAARTMYKQTHKSYDPGMSYIFS